MDALKLAVALEDVSTRLPKGVRFYEGAPGNPIWLIPSSDGLGNSTYSGTFQIVLTTESPKVSYGDPIEGKLNFCVLEIESTTSVEAMEQLILAKAQEVLAFKG